MSEPKPFRLKEPATGTCYTKAAQISYLKYPEGLTLAELMEELHRQPHLRPLEKALSPDRRFYLLCGAREELMQMACTYIGLYHALQDQGSYGEVDAGVLDEVEEQDEDGEGSAGRPPGRPVRPGAGAGDPGYEAGSLPHRLGGGGLRPG